jgi:hypothetical protein
MTGLSVNTASPERADMATLTVWKFNTPRGADDALAKLEKLHTEMLINLHDAAVVSWEAGRKKPRTHEMHDTTTSGALMGAFWGMPFGLIFSSRSWARPSALPPGRGSARCAMSGSATRSLMKSGRRSRPARRRFSCSVPAGFMTGWPPSSATPRPSLSTRTCRMSRNPSCGRRSASRSDGAPAGLLTASPGSRETGSS